MSTELSDLVALVYRCDWTSLSLSATLSHTYDPEVAGRLINRESADASRVLGPLCGAARTPRVDVDDGSPVHSEQRLLLAPGGRYRLADSDGEYLIYDGEHSWDISGGVAHRQNWPRPGSGFHGLLTPRWLIACYELQIVGSEVTGERAAIRVTGVPRPPATRHLGRFQLLDRVEVLVDAELGFLLSSRQVFEGATRESAELGELVIHPSEAAMPGLFVPPPDVSVDEEKPDAEFEPPSGLGWEVAGAAAGVAANALGFAVRHAPRRKTVWPTDDEEPVMPGDALLAPEDWEQGSPPDDRTLNLLHRTGMAALALTADVHEWMDAQSLMQNLTVLQEMLPAPLEGVLGPNSMWEAFGERAAEDGGGHRVARLAVQMPGRYRLDYVSGNWNKPYQAIASDGEHATKLFSDRVATGPVKLLDTNIGCMLDPAWLLNGWRLTVIGPARVAGRDGIHLRAVTETVGAFKLSTRADLVLDAEYGVLLRYTTYVGGQPATRTEFRDLRPLDQRTSFRIEPGPGQRSVADSGGPFGDRNMPRPAEAAATAASLAAVGAVAFTGWLEKHRTRRGRH